MIWDSPGTTYQHHKDSASKTRRDLSVETIAETRLCAASATAHVVCRFSFTEHGVILLDNRSSEGRQAVVTWYRHHRDGTGSDLKIVLSDLDPAR